MKKTLYQVLGLTPAATAEEIVAAHEQAMRKFDGGAHDRNEWIMVREAFAVLSNSDKRAMYDQSLSMPSALRAQARAIADLDEPARAYPWMKYVIGAMCVLAVLAFIRLKAPQAGAGKAATAVEKEVMIMPDGSSQPGVGAKAAGAADGTLSGEALYAKLAPSVGRVIILGPDGEQVGGGSGVAIGPDAMITNCHVAKAGARLQVKINQGSHDATIVTADEEHDLCLLQVSGMSARAVEIGSSSNVKTGQKVLALGAPRGLDLTMSDGIVSSLRNFDGATIIQTTAPVSPGSSGGGLFDTSGRLVGIITFQMVNGQNLNFAAPSDWISSMRTRPVGNGFFKEMADGRPGGESASTPAAQIVGKWHCRESLGGRSMVIDFRPGGQLVAHLSAGSVNGNWGFDGSQMTLQFSAQGGKPLKVESWSGSKIVLHEGEGERLICSRQ
jgi:serine protease Do